MTKPSFYNRVKTMAGIVVAWFAWEAGIHWGTKRGRVGMNWGIDRPNDANDQISREEIIRKAQEYERNSSIVNKLVDTFELFTVGAGGMQIIPSSGDEEWNAERKKLWDLWCKNPDLTSLESFGTLQSRIARRWFIDGQVFIYKTRSDQRPFRPRIQVIESARCRTPMEFQGRKDIIDGIEVDYRGRPVAYYFEFTENGENKFRRIEAKWVRSVGESMRGELRPFSFLSSVLGDITDLKELAQFAMTKAKDNAKWTNIFKTLTGELPDVDQVIKNFYSQTDQTAAQTPTTEEKMAWIEQTTGAKSLAIKADEDLVQYGGVSPNQIEQAHWDIIINRICAGVGITKQLLFPYGMQGTGTRADLDAAALFFKMRSSVLQDAFLDIYEFVTEEEIKFEPTIADEPEDWRKATCRAPRAPNVDVGYNTAAQLALYEAGATTLNEIVSPMGLDWREVTEQTSVELAYKKKMAVKYGNDPAELSKAVAENLKAKMDAENQKNAQQQALDDAELAKA